MALKTLLFVGAIALFPSALGSYLAAPDRSLAQRDINGGYCDLSPGSPPERICGKSGHLVKGTHLYKIAGVQSIGFNQCRDCCFNRNSPDAKAGDGACNTFSHNSAKNTCNLYLYNVNATNFVEDTESPVTYYAIDCYICHRKCPFPTGTNKNFLENPGFENSNRLIGPWQQTFPGDGSIQKVVAQGHDSANALLMDNGAEIQQVVGLCNGQDYLVGADFKFVSLSADRDCQGSIRIPLGDGEADINAKDDQNTWRNLLFSSRYGSSGDTIYVDVNSNCKMLLDNTFIKPINLKQVISPTVGESLLKNGGFETGKIKPWKITVDTSSTKNVTSEVVEPGLGANGESHRYKFRGEGVYLGFGIKQTEFSIQGRTSAPTHTHKRYVLSFTYRLTHKNDGFTVLINDGTYNWRPNEVEHQVKTFSRIFTGSGYRDTIQIIFDASDNNATEESKFVQSVELDNITLFELADEV